MAKRAPDFRYYFANAIGLGVSDNDCKIIFGIEEGPTPEDMLEQVAVAMTPRTMKLLASHLTVIVEHIERMTGAEIPFDPEKRDKLLEALVATSSASATEPAQQT